MDLNHLHLHVRSMPRAQAFYERYFGLRELVRHGSVVFMRDAAGMDLALAPDPEPQPMPPWFHFGFRLASPEQVERLHADMLAAGVAMREPLTHEDAMVYFRCADPDGYAIEVYWELQPA